MAYDQESFLAGIATGRNMKSWPSFEFTGGRVWAFTIELESDSLSFVAPIHVMGSEETASRGLTVYWGDGSVSVIRQKNIGAVPHDYEVAGTYTVAIFGIPENGYLDRSSANSFRKSLVRLHTPIPLTGAIPTEHPETLRQAFLGTFDYDRVSIFGPKIVEIDSDLLNAQRNRGEVEFQLDLMFSGCRSLEIVPDDLFEGIDFSLYEGTYGNPPIQAMFSGCTSLTKIGNIFNNPCFRDVISIYNIFGNCESLSDIPGDLFSEMVNLQGAGRAFRNCKSLRTIPRNLFSYSDSLYAFADCFNGCVNLRSIPDSLFDNITDSEDLNFRYCFDGCSGITGAVPDLWNRFPLCTKHEWCFSGCINAANYEDIPYSWGGPLNGNRL